MDLINEQRLARRAAILQTARQMIAEAGFEHVTVRALAERCGISVPTLYNQFGGKDGVLGTAIEEHFFNVIRATGGANTPSGLPRLLGIIDHCANQLLDQSAYHRRLLEAFASLETTTDVQRRIASLLATTMAEQLSTMQNKRQLASWVDPDLLAGQMTSACIGASIIWGTGVVKNSELHASMRYAAGLVLLGALRGQSAQQVQTLVQQAQTALQHAQPPTQPAQTTQQQAEG